MYLEVFNKMSDIVFLILYIWRIFLGRTFLKNKEVKVHFSMYFTYNENGSMKVKAVFYYYNACNLTR